MNSRIALCGFIVIAAMISWSEVQSQETRSALVLAPSGLNIRKEPSAKAPLLATVPHQAEVKMMLVESPKCEVIAESYGCWRNVEYNNVKGFMFDAFLGDSACKKTIFGTTSETAARWNSMLRQPSRVPLAERVEQFRTAYGYPVTTYPGGTQQSPIHPPNRVLVDYAPCGPVDTMFARNLSELKEYNLESVYEVDPSGNVLRTWNTPYNGQIASIRNDELIVWALAYPVCSASSAPQTEAQRVLALAIKPDGQFRIMKAEKYPQGTALDGTSIVTLGEHCSKTSLFKGSAFKGCSRFQDQKTGKWRILVFQGPCT